MLTVIVLTYNEEIHLSRLLQNITPLTKHILVVDSFSSDRTVEIATSWGAVVYQNAFVNNAHQFQWALDHCKIETEWVMKLDADEVLQPQLIEELLEQIPKAPAEINGFQVKCRVCFMGKWIKYGYYPMILNRVFRREFGFMEQKWMDEHIQLKRGNWKLLKYDIIDENLNNLSWWTAKHNNYSTREAIVRLNYKYNFLAEDAALKSNKSFYLELPKFLRGAFYFTYRYLFRLGFLDGSAGLIWHLLQGFLFQTLVDAKVHQIEYISKRDKKSIRLVIEQDFGIKL